MKTFIAYLVGFSLPIIIVWIAGQDPAQIMFVRGINCLLFWLCTAFSLAMTNVLVEFGKMSNGKGW